MEGLCCTGGVRLAILCSTRSLPRPPLQRGRKLSKEAILTVHRLKNAGRDREQMASVVVDHASRLLKEDMVRVLEELHRQNECHLAFEVFKLIRNEPWYEPNPYRYRRMMELLGKNAMIHSVERLFLEFQEEGLPLDANVYTELMGAYLRCRRPLEAIETFEEMKILGFKPEEFTFKVLIKGLIRKGLNDEADRVRAEYHQAGS